MTDIEDVPWEDIGSWYEGKSFSSDWTSGNFSIWTMLLRRYRDLAPRILEIGCWEGRSALFFLNYLPRSRLVCVDHFTFAGPAEVMTKFGVNEQDFNPDFEARFDANLAPFQQRVEKMRATSLEALGELGVEGRRFDIAYIDGSHHTADVYRDAVLTWPMIVRGGLVIFDDYRWEYQPGTREHPKLGIDNFLRAFEGDYAIVHDAYQLAITKL
jgi:predicted O-methyltransferase YrrM